jgi:hypothetical protein
MDLYTLVFKILLNTQIYFSAMLFSLHISIITVRIIGLFAHITV